MSVAQTRILIVSTRWRRFQSTEARASRNASASSPRYRLAEDIGFAAVVVAELKLSQIQRQILLAELMVIPNHATLQQCPKAFDVVGMDFAAHVLMRLVVNSIVRESLREFLIARAFVRRDQIDFLRNHLADESAHGLHRSIFDDLTDHATLARDRAYDGGLVERAATALLLIPVPVFVLAADVSLIDFDDTHQLLKLRVFHRSAQPHAHVPSRSVRSRSDHPMDLQSAHAFLAGQHEVQNLEPSEQRLLSFLKDGSGLERKAVGRAIVLAAFFALPMPRTCGALVYVIVVAARASRTGGPSAQEQIDPARPFIRKQAVKVCKRHLADEARFGVSVVAHALEISAKSDGSQVSHNPQIFGEYAGLDSNPAVR